MKECTRCHCSFSEETYYLGRNGKRRRECRDCHTSRYMKSIYGIDLDTYNQMLDDQKGGCAICGAPPTQQRLNIDHDHQTGEVRGLLCWRCNTTLGRVHDDPELLQAMVDYLGAL